MAFREEKIRSVIQSFVLDRETLQETAAAFRYDIEKGLTGSPESSLRMLNAYVGLPSGQETGEYIALDFGGTNVRALRIRLLGKGRLEIVRKAARPLQRTGVYDYVSAGSDAAALFGFLAQLIDEVIDGDRTQMYRLGHTFSFPSEQTTINNARLITWTKEFATSGVEGQVVNDLLQDALQRIGAVNVQPVAVINDTVAVLLAAAYKYPGTSIGSIYATGHNTCYFETQAGKAARPVVINMESGAFSKVLPNVYDHQIDAASEKPGEQPLEKMVSGRYLGELFGAALADLLEEHGSYGFTGIDMSAMLLDSSAGCEVVCGLIAARTGHMLTPEEGQRIRELAAAIVARSARLVTATYVGTLWHLQRDGIMPVQHIAVDGSLYEKMPLVQENIRQALSDLLGEDAGKIDTVLENGGSGVGAALAAAMVNP